MFAAFARLPRVYWFLVLGMLLNRVGSFVVPFLTLYLDHQHLDAAAVSTVIAWWGGGTILAGILGGQLADRWGRRPTMLASFVGGALALGGLGTAEGLVALSAFAFALGMVAELYRPAVTSAIADLVPPLDRARAFGHLTWAYNIGFAVSPLLAGLLIEHAGYGWLFVGDAATMLLAGAVIAATVPETRPAGAPTAGAPPTFALGPVVDPRFVPVLVAAFCTGMIMIQSVATLPLLMRADGIDASTYGRVIALNGLLIALLQPWLVPHFEVLGRYRVLPCAAVAFGTGFVLHAFGDSVYEHAGALVVWTLGEIALFPLCNAAVADLAPEQRRGRYQGAYWMAFAIANVAGPKAGALLLASAGERGWSLGVAAAGLAGGAALALVGVRVRRQRNAGG